MNLLLAQSTAPSWPDRLLGPDTPISALIFFLLICLALLAFVLVVLRLIYRTFKDSWDLFRWLHRSRDKAFPCTNCGYDLRHKPERCPECGQRVWFRNRRQTAAPIPPSSRPSAATALELPEESAAPPDIANNDPARPANR
jgi:hypothetical protein